jgi:hypothetical protein
LFVVGGFGELVDQGGAGQVADPASGFGGCSAQRDQQMLLCLSSGGWHLVRGSGVGL